MLYKILVTGSRDWTDEAMIETALVKAIKDSNRRACIVIHGDHDKGADALTEKVCRRLAVHTARVGALWESFDKAAGPIRNSIMVALNPHLVLTFSDDLSKSQGTADCRRKAERKIIDYSHKKPGVTAKQLIDWAEKNK